MKLLIAACFALLAAPLDAETLVGAWNCQTRNGDAAIGRNVTYHPDGRMTSRMTVRLTVRQNGRKGYGEMTASHDGRWQTKDKVLTEIVLRTHDPVISFTAQGKKSTLRGPESDRLRRAAPSGNRVNYVIRSLSADRMTLHYVNTQRPSDDDLRFTCRRTDG